MLYIYDLFSLSSEVNKTNGGSVEALQEHPTDPEKVVISLIQ